jgi:hypothetical protein
MVYGVGERKSVPRNKTKKERKNILENNLEWELKMTRNEKQEDEALMANTLMLTWCWLAPMKLIGEEARITRRMEGREREERQISLVAMNDMWAGGGTYWWLGIRSHFH